jgi:indole-3-glycerol phosphate synthase
MKLTSAIRAAKENNKVPLIAEIKVYSPKDGDLLKGRDPGEIIFQYEKGGACAISVVTEPEHFKGNVDIIKKIRKKTRLPVFRKDFIKKPEQIDETKKIGANAVLLTVSMLSKEKLKELNEYAHQLELETVVEIHNEDDLEKLNDIHPDIVGINNKDILMLEKGRDQIQPTLDLIAKVRNFPIVLSESGMRSLKDIRIVIEAGADAVLMGTALLQAGNITDFVEEIVHIIINKNSNNSI